MIELDFPPAVQWNPGQTIGLIRYRHTDAKEYLGISQQIFAQAMGWAQ